MKPEFGVLKMEVNEQVEQELKELFDLEEEMLDAQVEWLPNNLKRLTIKVPPHKGVLIKEFILRTIAKLKKENLN